ncbi:MAG: hypothetical protein Q4Q23_03910 [Methanobacteriaceae archaeon]|nr:hypothetical protein [Methanobacteriaceae archaeon]
MNPTELLLINNILIYIAIIIGIINIGLLTGLTHFYKESYKEIASKFTIGLLYFSIILLIGNILVILFLFLSLIMGIEINEFSGTLVYTALVLINLSQLIAFAILFKITWE